MANTGKNRAIITNNAADLVSAVRLGNWAHIPCFGHTLNLIVQHGLQEIKDIRTNVRKFIECFHRSSESNAKLFPTQTRMDTSYVPLKLKNYVSTRWNSTLYMLERLLKLKEPITVTVVQLLSEEEWETVKEICQVLKPIK